jgi:copper chaperone
MESIEFKVPAISCGHCVSTIQRLVGELEGVKVVHADVATKRVSVTFGPPATRQAIVAVLEEWDFPPAP